MRESIMMLGVDERRYRWVAAHVAAVLKHDSVAASVRQMVLHAPQQVCDSLVAAYQTRRGKALGVRLNLVTEELPNHACGPDGTPFRLRVGDHSYAGWVFTSELDAELVDEIVLFQAQYHRWKRPTRTPARREVPTLRP